MSLFDTTLAELPDWIDADPSEARAVAQSLAAARAAHADRIAPRAIGTPQEVMASVFAYYGVRPAAPVVKRPHYATVSDALSALDAECLRIGMTGRRS